MSHSSTSEGYTRTNGGRKPDQYSRPLTSSWGDRRSPGLCGTAPSQTRTSETIQRENGTPESHDPGERRTGSHDPGERRTGSHDPEQGTSAGSPHAKEGSRAGGRGGGFLRRSISEGHSIPTLPEEQMVLGELKAAPPLPDVSNIPQLRSNPGSRVPQPHSTPGSRVPPLSPLREPPYLAPEPPVEEEEEYEYPLVDCTCFQIYWSPFFANFCSNTLGKTLKHCSKKGTPAHRNLRPVKEGKVFKALRKVGEKANKKGSELKREWSQRRPTWNYQDAHFQQMELELQRLRKQLSLSEQNSLPNTLPPGTSHEPWSSSQFRMPPSGFNAPNSHRRFTMS